jgi:hypothetical protein
MPGCQVEVGPQKCPFHLTGKHFYEFVPYFLVLNWDTRKRFFTVLFSRLENFIAILKLQRYGT